MKVKRKKKRKFKMKRPKTVWRRTADAHLIASVGPDDVMADHDGLLVEAPVEVTWAEIETLCEGYAASDHPEFNIWPVGLRLGSDDPCGEDYAANRLRHFASLIGE